MVRRTPTESRTAEAGVILDRSFARFRSSMAMAMFSEEKTLSRAFWSLGIVCRGQNTMWLREGGEAQRP